MATLHTDNQDAAKKTKGTRTFFTAATPLEQMDFEAGRNNLLEKLNSFITDFDKFTREVAPKHYRSTGSAFCNLRELREGIKSYTQATPEELAKVEEWSLG